MGLKLKKASIYLIIFMITACSDKENTYYDNGNLKSSFYLNSEGKKYGEENIYYPTGGIMSKAKYKNGVWIDSIVKYDKKGFIISVLKKNRDKLFIKEFNNGLLISEGKVDSKLRPTGWWNVYEDNKLIAKQERIIVNGQSLINRENTFNQNTINTSKSISYELMKPELIKVGKQYTLRFLFHFDESDEKNNLLDKTYYYLLISPHINEDFSNLNSVSLDTLIPKKKNEFVYNLEFGKTGEKNLRGVIEKHTMQKENGKLIINKSLIFINEKIIVKR